MIRWAISALALCFSAAHGADSISLSDVGKLHLSYAQVQSVSHFEGATYPGSVAPLPGTAMKIVAPLMPQQVNYMVSNGEMVAAGQRIALLRGSEVHHFRENYAAQTALLKLAEERYTLNKKLVAQQAVSQEKWQQIAKTYFDTKLAWGHLNHFSELFEAADHEDEGYLLAPLDGIFMLPLAAATAEGELLGSVVAADNLRIRVTLPVSQAQNVSALRTSDCEVDVDRREGVASNRVMTVWSKRLPASCKVYEGQSVSVQTLTTQQAQAVPPQSVFYLNGDAHVFVASSTSLTAIAVEVLGQSQAGQLLVAFNVALEGQRVLNSSVSAMQGILIGLGEE